MVYIFLADGFEEIEALCPCDILRRGGVETELVSVKSELAVKSSRGITVIADKSISDIKKQDLQMIVFPGGMPGTKNLDSTPQVEILINYAVKSGIFIGAICAAPSILGKRGVLDGKKAVCYPGFEQYLANAVFTDERVVRDGNIITAKGAGASMEFGYALLSALTDEKTALKIRTSMC